MSTVHDVMAILELIPAGSAAEGAARVLLLNYEHSGILILAHHNGTAQAVELIGQLRENLLHELCALVDPAHGLNLPPQPPAQQSPYV